MTREEYFICLESYLKNLSYEECKEALKYYEDYFDEAGPENEQEVIDQLGSPKQLAETILNSDKEAQYGTDRNNDFVDPKDKQTPVTINNTNNSTNKKSSDDNSTKIAIVVIILLIAAPFLLGLAGTALGILCALLFGGLGLGIGGIAAIIAGFSICISGRIGMGISAIGVALILISIGIALEFLFYIIIRYFAPICMKTIEDLYNSIVGKKEAQ